ncbi:AAA-like domain-containing protein [Hyalangium rubrum]|uniref:AAA-like domain-containing protein n=1 Tax=Hyalangium rubrum TaxID=3103134 RepID=A0ABU5HD22_9BACT|nr:AAA-like domain-containing protein [Hyalangium sp. s54d21]MDY7231368.1 AAA-like domain-containing protein [Hyalangium sp. s54d21]
MADTHLFTTGGTVQASGGLYLTRRADEELLALCREGTFAFVLTARQMGKSSLMTRTSERLIAQGCRSVIIDLNALGTRLTVEQWYLGLLVELESQLSLKQSVTDWWHEHEHLGAPQRLARFLEAVVLTEVQERVVIFIDEIDTTQSMDFTDDCFATIRFLYNSRAQQPELKRLSFVLLGVATPGSLVKDPRRTPFNLGQRVELTDFTFEEALPLAAGLGLPPDQSQQVLRWALEWTGGHPYLTQRLCRELAEAGATSQEEVRAVVSRVFIGEKSWQDNNLQFVRQMLTKGPPAAPDVGDVLSTYLAVRLGRRVPDEEQSRVKSHLKLSGVVRRERDALVLRNAIYRQVFDPRWVRQNLPFHWKRLLQRAAPALVVIGLALLATLTLLLFRMAAEVDRRSAESFAVRTASRAQFLRRQRPEALPLSVLLAVESVRKQPHPDGLGELIRGTELMRPTLAHLDHDAPVQAVALSGDGKLLATASSSLPDGGVTRGPHTVRLWDTSSGKLLAQLEHEDTVRALAFSPDGSRLATASNDHAARLWDTSSGKLLARLLHQGPVVALSFNPQGSRLATASDDLTARLWAVSSGSPLAILRHDGPLHAVAFSLDGSRLATASNDRSARLWDASFATPRGTGPPLEAKYLALLPHDVIVYGVAFSPDGTRLATASQDNVVRLWAIASQKLVGVLKHDAPVATVAFSPDGTRLATAGFVTTSRLWDISFSDPPGAEPLAPEPLADLRHKGRVFAVAFSPDSSLLATGSSDTTARLWDASSGKALAILSHQGAVNAVAFGPDGSRLATGSDDHTARLWQAYPGKPLAILAHDQSVSAVAFSPDGSRLATSDDKTARLWEVSSGKLLALLPHQGHINALTFSPDGKLLATSANDALSCLWRSADGVQQGCLPHDGPVHAAAFSPDGTRLATASLDATARLWELSSPSGLLQFQFLARLPHEDAVTAVAFDPHGRLLATASNDGTARLWAAAPTEPAEARPLAILRHNASVHAVAFGPDSLLATASADHTARLWATSSAQPSEARPLEPQPVATLLHAGPVHAVAFSPDGTRLATASDDHTARLWDTSSGVPLVLLAHDGPVNTVTFGPEGKTLATSSLDTTARLWDVASGEALVRLDYRDAVNAVALSPDGRLLATATGNGTGHLAPWHAGELLEIACGLLDRNMTHEEWLQHIGNQEPYQRACPNLP